MVEQWTGELLFYVVFIIHHVLSTVWCFHISYIATYVYTHTHGTYWSNELWHVQYLQYTLIGCCFQCRSPYCMKTENLEDLCYTL